MVRIEHLQHFLVISELQSLVAAAKQLNRTPSALSMSLKHLEQSLGGQLFEGERKQQLTPLGEHVRERAKHSVNEHLRTLDDIHRYARGETGLVKVCTVPSVATERLPKVIARCFEQRPEIQIQLRDTDSKAVQQAIIDGSADIGVASLSETDKRLNWTLLSSDSFVCVCPVDHPLVQQPAPIAWRALDPYPFIYNGLCEYVPHDSVRELSRRSQLSAYNTSSLLAFVRHGLGVTLLPADSISDSEGLACIAIKDKDAKRSLYLLSHADRSLSPAARLVADVLEQEYCSAHH